MRIRKGAASKLNLQSFTLIELLIIIVILGFLTALISGNYISSLQKGRDARRKNDLAQIQRALETYYEDNKAYPTGVPPFGSGFCTPTSCVSGSKTYMVRTPEDPNASYSYAYLVDTDSQYYYLFSCIENSKNDKGTGVSNDGYYCPPAGPISCTTAPDCGACGRCLYVIGSSNALPLSPYPTIP